LSLFNWGFFLVGNGVFFFGNGDFLSGNVGFTMGNAFFLMGNALFLMGNGLLLFGLSNLIGKVLLRPLLNDAVQELCKAIVQVALFKVGNSHA